MTFRYTTEIAWYCSEDKSVELGLVLKEAAEKALQDYKNTHPEVDVMLRSVSDNTPRKTKTIYE